jgi:hypothetical protein
MTGSAQCGTTVPRGTNPDFASLHPGYIFTMSNSAVFFIPGSFCVRVLFLSLFTFVAATPD